MNPVRERDVLSLYRDIKMGQNSICARCRSFCDQHGQELWGPVGIYQVGDKYFLDPRRIVFVAKTARGTLHDGAEEQLATDGFIDSRSCADEWILEGWGAIWSYLAEIMLLVFNNAEEGWQRIAFTNLVKCNVSMAADLTPATLRYNCIGELRVIWKELEVLKPRHVIFLTGTSYDEYVAKYPSEALMSREISTRGMWLPVGNKKMYWWEREFQDGADHVRVLRTSHPERKNKREFTSLVSSWITETNLDSVRMRLRTQ